MAEKNNFLLIIAVIILLIIVVLVFNNISGLVTSDVAAKLETNPQVLTFSRFDNSHVVAVAIDSGSDDVGNTLRLKFAKDGSTYESKSLCDNYVCSGKLSKNFVINKNIESGEYYFEVNRVCKENNPECNNLNPVIKSGIIEIGHV